MPYGDAALDALTAFLARFCKIPNPIFDYIRKARDMEKCLYEGGRSDEDEKQDGEYHGFLRLAWARGVEIAKGADGWHVFNVVRVSEDEAKGSPYEGRFATSMDVASLKDADDICKWGRRRWDIESSFHVEKNGGYGLEHNFCNKARVSRNIYVGWLVMP